MDGISVLGVDLAKNVFQLHGVDEQGRTVLKRTIGRAGLLKYMAKLKPCLVGVEACGGARYWTREFQKLGHDARMMAPQFVKPFVKSDKNDANDAEAICEAVQRPNMRFVAAKSVEQQSIQMLHRIRSRRVSARTELCNEMRALLADQGIVVPIGLAKLRAKLSELLASEDDRIAGTITQVLQTMLKEWRQLDEHICESDRSLDEVFDRHEVCQRLVTIPGVGKITATAIIAAVGDINAFKSGRHLAAWLGLVPRQNSSGGKQRLGGITKRGDSYLRLLLIHGGRNVVRYAARHPDSRSQWIVRKTIERGKNKAAVAVANKNARVIWKLLKTTNRYEVKG